MFIVRCKVICVPLLVDAFNNQRVIFSAALLYFQSALTPALLSPFSLISQLSLATSEGPYRKSTGSCLLVLCHRPQGPIVKRRFFSGSRDMPGIRSSPPSGSRIYHAKTDLVPRTWYRRCLLTRFSRFFAPITCEKACFNYSLRKIRANGRHSHYLGSSSIPAHPLIFT